MPVKKKIAAKKTVKRKTAKFNYVKRKALMRKPRTSIKTPLKYKKAVVSTVQVSEALASYTTRIRSIGNSRGVILNNQIIAAAGIDLDADIIINAAEGMIYIIEAKKAGINTDLSTWDHQFKSIIKKGSQPETDLFEGLENEFDQKEWK